jgi:flagellar biosynthesis/type III secretory pathway protein FliH
MTRSPDGRVVDSRPVAPWQPPDLRTVAAAGAEAGPSVEEAAYQRGWDDGQAAERDATHAAHATQIAALVAVERALSDAAGLLQARFAESVNALSVGIARHLLDDAFEADPRYVTDLVTRALALAPLGGPLTVRVHPLDLDSIRDLPPVRDPAGATLDLRWVGDDSIIRGGCVVEGPMSVVDGRIDRVMLDIYERLASD